MQPTVKTLRAISSVVLRQAIRKIVLVAFAAAVFCYILVISLVVLVSEWFLLAFVVLLPVTVAVVVVGLLAWVASGALAPRKLGREESKAVSMFAVKVLGLLERARTPLPITIISIAKDVIRHRDARVVGEIIDSSKHLRSDFVAIQQMLDS